jgi:formamidopyrimidine-DNA glycosylase
VEAARRLVERHCAGRVIRHVESRESDGGPRDGQVDDKVICEGIRGSQLTQALLGQTLIAVHRRGKQLWFELHPGPSHPLFHFGMTGAFVVKGVEPLRYQEFRIDTSEWPPRFTKVELVFDADVRLAFIDPRRMGRIKLRADPLAEPPISHLGPDPFLGPFPLLAFRDRLSTIQAPVKAVLLDQERVVCGVGNWVADEVLFHSAIHPATPASTLTESEVKALHRAIVEVCATACAVDADSQAFPGHWLFCHRWGKGKNGARLPDGRAIVFETCAGRTSAWVPGVQKPPGSRLITQKKRKSPAIAPANEDADIVVTQPNAAMRTTGQRKETAAPPRKKMKAPDTIETPEPVRSDTVARRTSRRISKSPKP